MYKLIYYDASSLMVDAWYNVALKTLNFPSPVLGEHTAVQLLAFDPAHSHSWLFCRGIPPPVFTSHNFRLLKQMQ